MGGGSLIVTDAARAGGRSVKRRTKHEHKTTAPIASSSKRMIPNCWRTLEMALMRPGPIYYLIGGSIAEARSQMTPFRWVR